MDSKASGGQLCRSVRCAFAASILAGALAGCGTGPHRDLLGDFEQANTYYSRGLYSDAERILLSLAKKTPDNYEVHFKLGNIYVRTGQFEAAERAYGRCMAIDPEQPKGWYNMSLLRVKQALYLAEQGQRRSGREAPEFQPRFMALREGLMSTLGDKER